MGKYNTHLVLLLLGISLISCNEKKGAKDEKSVSSSSESSKSDEKYPQIVTDLLFGEPYEQFTKKYGDFKNDSRAVCKTPPKCDYYYIQEKMLSSCLWRGMNASADHATGKVKWAYLGLAGKCNGILDNELVGKYILKSDPAPKYLYLHENWNEAYGTWEYDGVYMNVRADCTNPETQKVASNFLDCRLLSISIKDKDDIKESFKKNNFKFY